MDFNMPYGFPVFFLKIESILQVPEVQILQLHFPVIIIKVFMITPIVKLIRDISKKRLFNSCRDTILILFQSL